MQHNKKLQFYNQVTCSVEYYRLFYTFSNIHLFSSFFIQVLSAFISTLCKIIFNTKNLFLFLLYASSLIFKFLILVNVDAFINTIILSYLQRRCFKTPNRWFKTTHCIEFYIYSVFLIYF